MNDSIKHTINQNAKKGINIVRLFKNDNKSESKMIMIHH